MSAENKLANIIAQDAHEYEHCENVNLFPKIGIELNGIANIDLLLKLETDYDSCKHLYSMNKETYDAITSNLNVLKFYMLAFNKAINDGTQPPLWHEVRDNLIRYRSR